MDPIAGQAALCPNCGSRNARWRNKRLYDYVFTWVRFFLDTVLSAILVRRPTPAAATGYRPDWMLRNQARALQYARQRAAYESKIGLAVGRRFWRCPDCRQKGQVFPNLDEELTTERAHLASMEDRIVGDLGAVGERVSREGLSDE